MKCSPQLLPESYFFLFIYSVFKDPANTNCTGLKAKSSLGQSLFAQILHGYQLLTLQYSMLQPMKLSCLSYYQHLQIKLLYLQLAITLLIFLLISRRHTAKVLILISAKNFPVQSLPQDHCEAKYILISHRAASTVIST